MTRRDDRDESSDARPAGDSRPGGAPVARALVCLAESEDGRALAAALRQQRLAVVVSASPQDARDAMAFGTPDVVVVEVAAGGGSTAREVLESAGAAGALALAVAPMSALGGGEELWALGVREVFHRPLDIEALAARITAGFQTEGETSGPSTRVGGQAPAHQSDTVFSPAPAFDPATFAQRGAAEALADGPKTEVASPPPEFSPAAPEPTGPVEEGTHHEQAAPEVSEPVPDESVTEAVPDADVWGSPEAAALVDDPLAGGVDSMVDELMAGFDFGDLPLPEGMGVGTGLEPDAAEDVPGGSGAFEAKDPDVEPEVGLVNPWDAVDGLGLDEPLSDVDTILANAGVSKPLFDPAVFETTEEGAAPAADGPASDSAWAPQPVDDAGMDPSDPANEGAVAEDGVDGAAPMEEEASGDEPTEANDLGELDPAQLGLEEDSPETAGADEDYDGPSTGEVLRAAMPFWRRHTWIAKAAIGALAAVMLGQLGYLGYQFFTAPSGTSPADGLVDSDADKAGGEKAAEGDRDEAAVKPSEVPEVPTLESEAAQAYGEGVLAAKAGDLDAAARHYRHILRKPVDHAGGMAGLSAVLIEQGHYGEAQKLLKELAADKPKDALVQLDLGLVANELDDKEGARQALKRYLELAPSDHEHREDVMRLVLALDGGTQGT